MDRRAALASAAVVLAVPDKWVKPVVESAVLPAHAGTSPVDQQGDPDKDVDEDMVEVCRDNGRGGRRTFTIPRSELKPGEDERPCTR